MHMRSINVGTTNVCLKSLIWVKKCKSRKQLDDALLQWQKVIMTMRSVFDHEAPPLTTNYLSLNATV